jgi:HAD superfamily phosphoserine phosphatase-like hydrolase
MTSTRAPHARVPSTLAPIGPGDVVAADLEGTLTDGETWKGVGAWLALHGRRRAYRRFLVPRVPLVPFVRVGLIDRQAFRDRWMRDLASLLAGSDESRIAAMADWVIDEELWPARREPMLRALAEARDAGARVVIVSGAFAPILDRFAARVGVEGIGTPIEVVRGIATGRLPGPVNTGPWKVERLARRIGIAPLRRAYGDSAADLPLLAAAAEAVPVTPDGTLARVARERGWRVLDATGSEVDVPASSPRGVPIRPERWGSGR